MYSVYAIAAEAQFIKFGVAKNVARRLLILKTSSPLPLRIIAVLRDLPREEAYSLETMIHRTLRHHNSNGEWFVVNADTARVAKYVNELSSEALFSALSSWRLDKALRASRDAEIEEMLGIQTSEDREIFNTRLYGPRRSAREF